MMRTATALLAVLAAAPLWLVPAGRRRARAARPAAASPDGRYQRQAFKATNARRSAADRIALRRQDCVQRFAVQQAQPDGPPGADVPPGPRPDHAPVRPVHRR